MTKILEINNLKKNYYTKMGEVEAIENLSFDVNEEEFLCIIGSSGCGKSTLLNILADIDFKTDGEIIKNKDFRNYKKCENEVNFLILEINKILKELTKKGGCGFCQE